MGNICGKQESDPFAQPGRRLGSAPPPSSGTAPVPAAAGKKKVGGPPRTLGGGGGSASASGGPDEARRQAAAAAEVRLSFPQFLSWFPMSSLGNISLYTEYLAIVWGVGYRTRVVLKLTIPRLALGSCTIRRQGRQATVTAGHAEEAVQDGHAQGSQRDGAEEERHGCQR